ncbi:MAG: HAMP domain-containing histidine kinase [Clostridiales bacterium]|nr:HAMP domain-containing histidine kinase [Clostridiales bacterium]
MSKSIFTKYFALTCVIILVCFTILGALFLTFAANYWVDEKEQLYSDHATQLAAAISENGILRRGQDGLLYYSISQASESAMQISASGLDADIFIVKMEGSLSVCSEGSACKHAGRLVSARVMQTVMQGSFYEVGRLDGYFDDTYYTAGAPIILRGSDGEELPLGAVFVSSNADSLSGYIVEVLKMFLLAALSVMFFSFCAMYLLTYRMVKPLRQMAMAARRFGEGDFSFRVPVRGRDEMSELAIAFNSMATSLASLEDMRRSFVGNVSHELKTPMTTIAGFIDGILDGTIPPSEKDKYLGIVSQEVKRLSRMVRTMLDISRAEAGELKMNPVPFDIGNMVFQILVSFETPIEQKKIEIQGLEDLRSIQVVADRDLMYQSVYNLIENAVKFTNEGGYIRFTLKDDGTNVHVTIRNSGDGIPARELPQIFERFYKSDKSRGRDKTGVGLGLYIVQMLIGLHHGEIFVRSIEGEYCEFEFYIPRNSGDAR